MRGNMKKPIYKNKFLLTFLIVGIGIQTMVSCFLVEDNEEFVIEGNYRINSTCNFQNMKTDTIGSQIWMAENLNCDEAEECYEDNCGKITIGICGGDKKENCTLYGRLYDWATTMGFPFECNERSCASYITAKHRGICPEGWHVPSNDDWNNLLSFVGSDSTAIKLKAKEGWKDCGPTGSGQKYVCNDEFGFTAVPAEADYQGIYNNDHRSRSFLWSANQYAKDEAYYFGIWLQDPPYLDYFDKTSYKLSVRCLKD